jgi:hypothetical protein
MLVFVISAFSGQVYAATVECTLITPKWLGLGRLSKTLEEQQLVDFSRDANEIYNRNQVRKMMRKAVINNVGRRAEHTFTFHPIYESAAEMYVNYDHVNDDFKEGVTFALITLFHNSVVPVLSTLDENEKIEILDDTLLKPITTSSYNDFNQIYQYMNLYHVGSYGGMLESITLVDDVHAEDYTVKYQGTDASSKRNIIVGNCKEI